MARELLGQCIPDGVSAALVGGPESRGLDSSTEASCYFFVFICKDRYLVLTQASRERLLVRLVLGALSGNPSGAGAEHHRRRLRV